MRHYIPLMLLVFTLAACKGAVQGAGEDAILTQTSFAALDGWSNDSHDKAFEVYAKGCGAALSLRTPYVTRTGQAIGDVAAWRRTCQQARAFMNPTDDEARAFFEEHFTPYHVTTGASDKGRLTGYYEPLLHGSRTKTARYHVPVYGVPAGMRKPFLSRAQIEAGQMRGRAPVLMYVDDAVMLFFLHIQGSGKVRMSDGQMIGLQYAAQNGHGYVPIGRIMKERGLIEKVSLQTIRDWLYANPRGAQEIMNTNPSYVFFRTSPGAEYAKGALAVPLTPWRSLAIDDDRAVYGLPIFIDSTTTNPRTGDQEPLQKLMVSQDTGGAIIGGHRGDIFYGRGSRAEYRAGHQNALGNVYWLLPNSGGGLFSFLE
jgi:membrane-bound lytic murein transglycosylase A